MIEAATKGLAGRQVLLVGIGFYDYEQAIAEELRRQGATVLVYDELPSCIRRGPLAPLLRRLSVDIQSLVHAHHERILAEIAQQCIDHVIVIKGEHMTPWFLEALRRAHSGVKIVAYHWDSLVRYPRLVELQSHFDRVYTFDHADAIRFPDFRFRPLFFRPEIERSESQSIIGTQDLTFVGWLHHSRLRQLNDIYHWSSGRGLAVFFHVYTGWFSRLRLCLQGKGRFVRSHTLGYARYVDLLYASHAILDLPHPEQTGLTMRAIEALGAGKKLITTARDIVRYDFYRSENILVIDAEHPRIEDHFLQVPTVRLPVETIARYTLHSWVRELFDLDDTSELHLAKPLREPKLVTNGAASP